jgi:hypothetical protein
MFNPPLATDTAEKIGIDYTERDHEKIGIYCLFLLITEIVQDKEK